MNCMTNPIKDERGAIMVIAVFFAIFAVSLLYLAIGASEAVLFREHIQDAADSAALSGAITHARIMNLLVLINMVMVALLAVLVTLKLIEGIAIIGMAIAAGLAFCTFGVTLAAIPPLSALQQTMHNIYETVKPMVFNALEILHDASGGISSAAPKLAEAMAQGDIVGKDDGIEAKGFGASTVDELPVKDDSFEGLCGKAGQLSLDIAWIPLNPIPGLDEFKDLLEDPMYALTSSLSKWFCGDGQNSLPDLSRDLHLGFPKTVKAAACESNTDTTFEEGQEQDATSDACRVANEEMAAAKPDAKGNCLTQCDLGGPFDTVTAQARKDCDPANHPNATKYRYQYQQGTVEYKWNGAEWVRGAPNFDPSKDSANLGKDDAVGSLPCNSPADASEFLRAVKDTRCGDLTKTGYLPGYNKTVHPAIDPERVLPVCTNECPPQDPPPDVEKDPTRTVSFRQVTHVFSCVRFEKKEVHVNLSSESPKSEAEKGGNSKSPKGMVGGIKVGDERFQFRAVVVADSQQHESARLVRLALWKRPDPMNPIERLRKLGGFSFAQAEYYYDGSTDEEWMWAMKWRGRLKRFELPKEDEANDALQEDCQFWGNIDCAGMLKLADNWKDLLLH